MFSEIYREALTGGAVLRIKPEYIISFTEKIELDRRRNRIAMGSLN